MRTWPSLPAARCTRPAWPCTSLWWNSGESWLLDHTVDYFVRMFAWESSYAIKSVHMYFMSQCLYAYLCLCMYVIHRCIIMSFVCPFIQVLMLEHGSVASRSFGKLWQTNRVWPTDRQTDGQVRSIREEFDMHTYIKISLYCLDLLEIPLPQVTEQALHSPHSPTSQPGLYNWQSVH